MKYKIKGLKIGPRLDVYTAHHLNSDELFRSRLMPGDIVEYTVDGVTLTMVLEDATSHPWLCDGCDFGDNRLICPRKRSGSCLLSRGNMVFKRIANVMEEL